MAGSNLGRALAGPMRIDEPCSVMRPPVADRAITVSKAFIFGQQSYRVGI
jgi:hypothetical protein